MADEPEERRSTDLGMLTLGKLALIITLTGAGFTFINSNQIDRKISDLELRLSSRFADRSQVVDLSTYHASEARLTRLEADVAAQRVLMEAQQAEVLRLRLERQAIRK